MPYNTLPSYNTYGDPQKWRARLGQPGMQQPAPTAAAPVAAALPGGNPLATRGGVATRPINPAMMAGRGAVSPVVQQPLVGPVQNPVQANPMAGIQLQANVPQGVVAPSGAVPPMAARVPQRVPVMRPTVRRNPAMR